MTSTAGDCAVMMFQFSLSAAWYKDHSISRFTRVSGEEKRDPADRVWRRGAKKVSLPCFCNFTISDSSE